MTSSHNVFALAAALGAILLNSAPTLAAPDEAAKASCKVPSAPAAISNSVPAETPLISLLQGATGTTTVQITLSGTGALETATIAESSGNSLLDQAAISAARAQQYSPELKDCQPVNGSYVVFVDFNS